MLTAGRGSFHQEKPRNLPRCREPQIHKVFAGCQHPESSSLGRTDVSSFLFKQLVNNLKRETKYSLKITYSSVSMATSFQSQKPSTGVVRCRVKVLSWGGRSRGMTPLGGEGETSCRAQGLSKKTPEKQRLFPWKPIPRGTDNKLRARPPWGLLVAL